MICANKKKGIPCDCGTSEIPESILESVTAEVLGLAEFDAEVFKAKVKQIVVPKNKTLVYHLTNGKTVTREWFPQRLRTAGHPNAGRRRQSGRQGEPLRKNTERHRARV